MDKNQQHLKRRFVRAALSPVLAGALCFACFAGSAVAQTDTQADRTAQLLKKVQELEADLAAIKAELSQRGPTAPASSAPLVPAAMAAVPSTTAVSATALPPAMALVPATAAAGSPAPPVAPTPEPAPVQDAAVAAMLAPDTPPGDAHTLGPLEFRGYGDFGFGRPIFSALPPGGLAGSTQSFNLGDFDLFVNARLSDHLSVLGEMLVTSDFTNEYSVEMDRLMITYAANKYFKISAGKFHTAIGYYSNAFYRARFFQTATGAPILFTDEDDGGILPVHSIGLSATGELPSGPLGLHWVAEIGNGMAATINGAEPIQNFADENNGKAVNFALVARPGAVRGLDVGVSFYRDMQYPAGLTAIEERIYSAHAALVQPHLELIAEGVLLQHDILLTARTVNTVSTYGQASYKVGPIRPYFRYEYQNVPTSDPIFIGFNRLSGPSLGVRYDFSDFAAFKLQYGLLGVRSGPSTSAIQAQLAFAF